MNSPHDLAVVGEKLGIKSLGVKGNLHWFNDPLTKSTIVTPHDATPEFLIEHLKKSRAKFEMEHSVKTIEFGLVDRSAAIASTGKGVGEALAQILKKKKSQIAPEIGELVGEKTGKVGKAYQKGHYVFERPKAATTEFGMIFLGIPESASFGKAEKRLGDRLSELLKPKNFSGVIHHKAPLPEPIPTHKPLWPSPPPLPSSIPRTFEEDRRVAFHQIGRNLQRVAKKNS